MAAVCRQGFCTEQTPSTASVRSAASRRLVAAVAENGYYGGLIPPRGDNQPLAYQGWLVALTYAERAELVPAVKEIRDRDGNQLMENNWNEFLIFLGDEEEIGRAHV